MEQKIKVNKIIVDDILSRFKYTLIRSQLGWILQKTIVVELPVPDVTDAFSRNSIEIEPDCYFLCKELYCVYTYVPNLLAVTPVFLDCKIWNNADSVEIMRNANVQGRPHIDIRVLGEPWQHNQIALESKDKWYKKRATPFPKIFKPSSRLFVECNYYHGFDTTHYAVFIFRGQLIETKFFRRELDNYETLQLSL